MFWAMVQNVFDQSDCRICKSLISQEITNLWSLFCACEYTFSEPKKWFSLGLACASSRKHCFPNDNSSINLDNGDKNMIIVVMITMRIMMIVTLKLCW